MCNTGSKNWACLSQDNFKKTPLTETSNPGPKLNQIVTRIAAAPACDSERSDLGVA